MDKPEQCMDLCKKWRRCRFFSTLSGLVPGRLVCLLKGGPETWRGIKLSRNALSGSRDCGKVL